MAKTKEYFVLDTSAFTGIGTKNKAQIMKHIKDMTELISAARGKNVSCYTPPVVWQELSEMLRTKKVPKRIIQDLDASTIQKSPSTLEMQAPAEFIYQYVNEVRNRFYRGLREAEKAVIKGAKGKEEDAGDIIRDLREKYKTAIRQGMLDSTEDLEVLLLAKELNAGVVTQDEGIKHWANKWGIRFIDGESFVKLLKQRVSKK